MRSRKPDFVRTLLAWTLAAGLAAAVAEAQARFGFPADPDFAVVTFEQIHEDVEEADNVLSISIFGDGRVEMHLPFYVSPAGDYELELTQGELRSLLAQLERHGMMSFDAEEVRKRRERAEAARRAREGTLVEVQGGGRLELEIALASFTPVTGGPPTADVRRTVSWRSAGAEARLYPEVTEFRGLVEAEKLLLALVRRQDAVRKTKPGTIRIGE